MYRIIDGKGMGKTGRLMLLAKENDCIIACSNPHAMEEKARRYGIFGIDFISYWDLIKAPEKHEAFGKHILIDELETFGLGDRRMIMGYYLSLAKVYASQGRKDLEKRNIVLSVVVPTILHGIYDFCLFVNIDAMVCITKNKTKNRFKVCLSLFSIKAFSIGAIMYSTIYAQTNQYAFL